MGVRETLIGYGHYLLQELTNVGLVAVPVCVVVLGRRRRRRRGIDVLAVGTVAVDDEQVCLTNEYKYNNVQR